MSRPGNDAPEARPGRIVAAYGRRVVVETPTGQRVPCRLFGRRLQLVCGDTVRWTLQPQSVEIVDGRTIEIERAVVDGGRRVAKSIRVLRAGSDTLQWHESVRLFDADELDALAARAGLRVEATYGDFEGHPHEAGETRRLVVLRKARAA